jgi:hypothetical protein
MKAIVIDLDTNDLDPYHIENGTIVLEKVYENKTAMLIAMAKISHKENM